MLYTNCNNNQLNQLPKNWVVFRLSSLGDIILTTGVIEYWHKQFQWNITIITLENASSLFKNNPNVQNIISLKKEQLTIRNFLPCFYKIAQQFSKYGFIDLHNTNKSWFLKLLWKGPTYTYNKLNLERRFFLFSKKNLFKNKLNEFSITQRYANAVEKIPPKKTLLTPKINLLDEEITAAKNQLSKLIIADKKIVALHPYSLHKNKAWRTDGWKTIIKQLTKKGIPWFIIGHGLPMETIHRDNDFTNKTTLRETCALLHHSSVLITGDSGPMHLATAIGTPVIALFGPTTKEWGFFPIGEEHTILEAKDLTCRPCSLHGEKLCPVNQLCMEHITHEHVLDAIEHTLQKKAK